MIYIQSNTNGNLPHHFDAACAMYGAIETGQDFRLISYEDVKSGKYDNLIRRGLFVGSVEFMNEVFSRIGLSNIRVPKNSNREHKVMKLGDVKKLAIAGEKWFIKPFKLKEFTGFVLDQMAYSAISNISDELEVMVYKPFESEIQSEFRCYISMGRIKDIKNYSGDPFITPDESYIKSIIKQNVNFPISYTIDVGILKGGENVVVEFNDMWAIGNYGIQNDTYLSLLRQRYFEIIKQ
jgi:hypothetical protein